MSKRYLISLLIVTLLMVTASFIVLWTCPGNFLVEMPLLALYFGVICGLQHWVVTRAMYRSPRTFVQVFLGSVVAVLFIHIIILAIYLFTNTLHARPFLIAFCIGYAVSLVFETVALVQFVKQERTKRNQGNQNS